MKLNQNQYFENQEHGKTCDCCKKSLVTTERMFFKSGWFRGDDDYVGKICKECKKKINNNQIFVQWNQLDEKFNFINQNNYEK